MSQQETLAEVNLQCKRDVYMWANTTHKSGHWGRFGAVGWVYEVWGREGELSLIDA